MAVAPGGGDPVSTDHRMPQRFSASSTSTTTALFARGLISRGVIIAAFFRSIVSPFGPAANDTRPGAATATAARCRNCLLFIGAAYSIKTWKRAQTNMVFRFADKTGM